LADVVGIWNRALQMLGAKAIASTTENSVNARACQTCYDAIRQSELRGHYWNFARKRAILAASATPPLFDRDNAYILPADFLMLVMPDFDQNFNDRQWQIEGNTICCDDKPPLQIIYIADITDPTLMDSLFREMLSAKMGEQMSEQLTQSNSKIATCNANYKIAESKAKKANAFENAASDAPEDIYITTRA
jgi:hypothetical protein